jgi:methyl-accepting chemotaxis protein
LVDEVGAGSTAQTRGIEQVARAVAQLQELTQTVAAGAEEGAASSQQLNAQAGVLGQALEFLATAVGR